MRGNVGARRAKESQRGTTGVPPAKEPRLPNAAASAAAQAKRIRRQTRNLINELRNTGAISRETAETLKRSETLNLTHYLKWLEENPA